MIPNAYRIFNFDLGETADAIRQTVHDFASNEIAPRAAEIDKSNQFPRDLWPKIGALGLHGISAIAFRFIVSRSVGCPRRAEAHAASQPACPAPTTMTSYVFS